MPDLLVLRSRLVGDFHRVARRSGHVRGAETHHFLTTGQQVPGSGQRRKFECGVRADDGTGLARGEGLEADPVGDVRHEVAGLRVDALRGEEQVDGEGPAQAADGLEDLDEVGVGDQQLRELVHDDEEGGQGRAVVLACAARVLVLLDFGEVPSGPQQFLAPAHLALEGLLHSGDQEGLLLEVGDHGGHVGQGVHAGEGRAAFEVDEDEVELDGVVGEGHGEHHGAQHLGLAGARGADEHAVGAHAVLRRFLDVDNDGRPGVGQAEGDAQVLAALAVAPALVRIEEAHVPQPQQVHEVGGSLLLRFGGDSLGHSLGEAREAPGDSRCLTDAHLIGTVHDWRGVLLHDLAEGHRHHGALPVDDLLAFARAQDEPEGGRRLQILPRRSDDDPSEALHPLLRHGDPVRRVFGAVDDQEDMGPGPASDGLPPVLAARLYAGAHELVELLRARRDHAGRAHRVLHVLGAGVGQPFHPIPQVNGVLARQDGDP